MANSPNQNFAAGFMTSVAGLASSYAQQQAAIEQGKFADSQARINARFAEMEARDIITQGNNAAAQHGKGIKQLLGKQRAAMAAQGIQIGVGTAAEIESQTREIGAEEQRNIRNNAWRQAFGLKVQAAGFRHQGAVASSAASFAATNTIVAGGLNFLTGVGSAANNSFGKTETKKPQKVETFDVADYGKPDKQGK